MARVGRRIGRVKNNTLITSFDGEREVANLKVYPIDMAPDKHLKEKLERLGERYFEILQSGNIQVDYDGDCLGKKKRYVSTSKLRTRMFKLMMNQSTKDEWFLIQLHTGHIAVPRRIPLQLATCPMMTLLVAALARVAL
jgi:hypothetical protein